MEGSKGALPRLVRLKRELFPDRVSGAITIGSAVGVVIGVLGSYSEAFGLINGHAPNMVVAAFLWVSYVSWAVLFAGLYSVHRSVVVQRRAATEQEVAQRAAEGAATKALILTHKMSERVRACVCWAPAEKYACQNELQHVLGEGIRSFLDDRLEGGKYSITVKRVVDGQGTLETVFRDQAQDDKIRPLGEREALQQCYIYTRFQAKDGSQPRRWVLVRDTQLVDEAFGAAIKERGSARQYRSTIAFPLREPLAQTASTRMTALIGLLCIDSPQPNAFDGLFRLSSSTDGLDPGLHGEQFTEQEDMHLFFGLADSVATILVLGRDKPKRVALGG